VRRIESTALRVPVGVPRYLTSGWVSVSIPNLIVICVIVALFVLALVLPFPSDRDTSEDGS